MRRRRPRKPRSAPEKVCTVFVSYVTQSWRARPFEHVFSRSSNVSVNGLIKFFQDGGFFLYPLVIIFVVGVAIAIERWVYLTVETARNRSLWDDVAPHLGAGNFKQAITLANNSQGQIGTVLKYR